MKKSIVYTLFVFFIALAALYIVRTALQQREQKRSEQLREFEHLYTGALETFRINARSTFETIIMQPDVLEQLRRLPGADAATVSDVHDALYALLGDRYAKMHAYSGARQLHFHLADGRSLLRMHRPEKYGDPLFGVRTSVRLVNETLQPVEGFEEGRIFNGIRYVFPLLEGNRHYGSVEVSFSVGALIEWMNRIDPEAGVGFVIDRAVVSAKVFDDERGNYLPSAISADYAEDRAVARQFPARFHGYLNALGDDPSVTRRMHAGAKFVRVVTDAEGSQAAALFLPMRNLEGYNVAYLIRFDERVVAYLFSDQLAYRLAILLAGALLAGIVTHMLLGERERTIAENARLSLLLDKIRGTNEMMMAQSRQAAMGEMTGLLAHQWRQPISTIEMNVNNLLLDLELGTAGPEQVRAELADIAGRTEHLSELISDFMAHFGSEDTEVEVTLPGVVGEALAVMHADLEARGVQVRLLGEDDRRCRLNRNALFQVCLKLLMNAKEILGERGVAEPVIRLEFEATPEGVSLSVCDNAGGISVEPPEKVFEPYYTTKESLNESGIGLYVARLIAQKKLHGTLDVRNDEHGACFRLSLPCKPREEAEEGVERFSSEAP